MIYWVLHETGKSLQNKWKIQRYAEDKENNADEGQLPTTLAQEGYLEESMFI